MTKNLNSNDAWKLLFEKYDILHEVKTKGFFNIEAPQIKEFREPRLMAKWDTSESLPRVLKRNKINILPTSRGSYILSDFKLYEKIPKYAEDVTEMQKIIIPDFETIDTKNITSESGAINILKLSSILDDFLNEDYNFETFNGRMGTGKFNFSVDRFSGSSLKVNVKNAQCEIDGGFENRNSVVILEAKNVLHPDFHIRQLYYPYRLWKAKVKKPIRLIFSIYTNQIFRLLEYQFNDVHNYSSIELIQEKNYTFQDTEITNQDLEDIYKRTAVKTDDNQSNTDIPFIQADSFERIISLLENLQKRELTEDNIADIMQFEKRQSNYYYNAGRYLGLFEKYETYQEVDGKEIKDIKIKLTRLGKKVAKMNYKDRQLTLVSLILEHKIFNELFLQSFLTGEIPKKREIQEKMRLYNVCNEGQISRRSRSVLSWLKWIFRLAEIEHI